MSGRSLLTTVTSLCSSPCSPVEALPYSTHLCLHPEKASQHLRCTAARLAKPQLCLRLQAVLEGSAAGAQPELCLLEPQELAGCLLHPPLT